MCLRVRVITNTATRKVNGRGLHRNDTRLISFGSIHYSHKKDKRKSERQETPALQGETVSPKWFTTNLEIVSRRLNTEVKFTEH